MSNLTTNQYPEELFTNKNRNEKKRIVKILNMATDRLSICRKPTDRELTTLDNNSNFILDIEPLDENRFVVKFFSKIDAYKCYVPLKKMGLNPKYIIPSQNV